MKKKKKPAEFFCVDCGDELENFATDPKEATIREIKKRLAGCKEKGRNQNNLCSRLFIADEKGLGAQFEGAKVPLSKKKRDDLRKGVMKKIRTGS